MKKHGPMRFINEITIERQPSAVFAYLADLENLPHWNYAIRETRKITTGPVAVGSRYEQTRTVPVRTEEHLEVIEFEPGRRLALRGSLNSLPAVIGYTLRAEGDATVLTNTVELRPPPPLALLAPVATRRIKSAVATNLDVLRRILERR
jgi:uncharacterized protein YndB with AHSA1/START domain